MADEEEEAVDQDARRPVAVAEPRADVLPQGPPQPLPLRLERRVGATRVVGIQGAVVHADGGPGAGQLWPTRKRKRSTKTLGGQLLWPNPARTSSPRGPPSRCHCALSVA